MQDKTKTIKLGGDQMLKHYITKYTANNEKYAESWMQVNFFGKIWCFSKRKITL